MGDKDIERHGGQDFGHVRLGFMISNEIVCCIETIDAHRGKAPEFVMIGDNDHILRRFEHETVEFGLFTAEVHQNAAGGDRARADDDEVGELICKHLRGVATEAGLVLGLNLAAEKMDTVVIATAKLHAAR